MNDWLKSIFGAVMGLLGAGLILLVAAPPRGEPVTLLPPPTPAPLMVYVTGAIAEPGVQAIPVGSRVQDAIMSAGGFLPNANSDGLNLAAKLEDGAQIVVAAIQPTSVPNLSLSNPSPSQETLPTPTPAASSVVLSGETTTSDLVNINTADSRALETLSGVGPATAQKIIAYREENGSFATIDDLINVSGIGPATLEKLRPYITTEP
jgi:competence protein ComEA